MGFVPSRYLVTKDGMVVMASEAGVLDIPPGSRRKGRLQPGRMFLIDTVEGRIVEDEEIKPRCAARKPYRQWLDENLSVSTSLPEPPRRRFRATRPTTCSASRPSATRSKI